MTNIPMAREIMSTVFFAVHPNTEILEAIKTLHKRQAAVVPVVDDTNQLVGLLTEKDCLRVLSNDAYDSFGLAVSGKVADYMSELTAVLKPDMDLFTCAAMFLSTNFRCLPVLENGKVIGHVSRQDMLSTIIELEQRLETDKTRERARAKTSEHPDGLGDYLSLAGTHDRKQLETILSKRQNE